MLWNGFPLQQIIKVVGVNVTSCTFLGIVSLNVVHFHQCRKRWTLEVQRYQCMADALQDAFCYHRPSLWDIWPFGKSFLFYRFCNLYMPPIKSNKSNVRWVCTSLLFDCMSRRFNIRLCNIRWKCITQKQELKTCRLVLASKCGRLS